MHRRPLSPSLPLQGALHRWTAETGLCQNISDSRQSCWSLRRKSSADRCDRGAFTARLVLWNSHIFVKAGAGCVATMLLLVNMWCCVVFNVKGCSRTQVAQELKLWTCYIISPHQQHKVSLRTLAISLGAIVLDPLWYFTCSMWTNWSLNWM